MRLTTVGYYSLALVACQVFYVSKNFGRTAAISEPVAPNCSPLSARIEPLGVAGKFPGFVEVHHERNVPVVSVRLSRDRLLFRGPG